jgi:hypothetical protein
MATGTGATGGDARDIGTVSVGPGGQTYLGTDGQRHQYIGTNSAGELQFDPAYPPAPGQPGTGATGSGAGTGSSAGQLATQAAAGAQSAIGWAGVGIASLYIAGILTQGIALVLLVAILGFFELGKSGVAAATAANKAVRAAKEWVRKELNGIVPGLGDKISGLVVGGVITVIAGGVSYYLFRDKSGRLVIVKSGSATRSNPARRIRHRRPMRRVN